MKTLVLTSLERASFYFIFRRLDNNNIAASTPEQWLQIKDQFHEWIKTTFHINSIKTVFDDIDLAYELDFKSEADLLFFRLMEITPNRNGA